MGPIRSMTDFYRLMHKKARQKRGVLMVKGAELVHAMPSQVAESQWGPGPKSIEEQEHSANAETPTTGL